MRIALLIASVASASCRGGAPRTVEIAEIRATVYADDSHGKYEVRLPLPVGYRVQETTVVAVWLTAPSMPAVVVELDTSDKNASRTPCDLDFGGHVVPVHRTQKSRLELRDGFVVVCDDADELGRETDVIRLLRFHDKQFFCVAHGVDLAQQTIDAVFAGCRDMGITGPHLDDLDPGVGDEVSLLDPESSKRIHARIRVPIGFTKRVHDNEVAWFVPNTLRLTWPQISIKLDSIRDIPYLGDGKVEIKRYERSSVITRRIPLGPAMSLRCFIALPGKVDKHVQQMAEVCASLSATVGDE
jgi:hypothetical protein